MTDVTDEVPDVALEALDGLAAVATSSIGGLAEMNSQLAEVRRRRRRGWTWQRIVADRESPNPLAMGTKIAANLAVATGEFRRALVHSLRGEGMQLSKIGPLLEVSRQRVGALLRPRNNDPRS